MMKKIILITGGNRGIGLEICRQLCLAGHQVILGSRRLENGKKAVKSLGFSMDVQQLEVTNKADISQVAKYIETTYGHLDVLINNAGILVGEAGVLEPDFDVVTNTLNVNFYGAWKTSLGMLPLLKKSSDGRIINMSSSMGSLNEMGNNKTGHAGYRISKTALNALTILLSNELQGAIKVNTMSPGWVKTDMGGAGADRSLAEGADTAVWLATAEVIPNGKFVKDRAIVEW